MCSVYTPAEKFKNLPGLFPHDVPRTLRALRLGHESNIAATNTTNTDILLPQTFLLAVQGARYSATLERPIGVEGFLPFPQSDTIGRHFCIEPPAFQTVEYFLHAAQYDKSLKQSQVLRFESFPRSCCSMRSSIDYQLVQII